MSQLLFEIKGRPASEASIINLQLKTSTLEHHRQAFLLSHFYSWVGLNRSYSEGSLLRVCSSHTAAARSRHSLHRGWILPGPPQGFALSSFSFAPSLPSGPTTHVSPHQPKALCSLITTFWAVPKDCLNSRELHSKSQVNPSLTTTENGPTERNFRNVSPSEWASPGLTSLKTQPYPLF